MAGVSRDVVAAAKRLVVKIGSSSLASQQGGLDADRVDSLVDAVAGRVEDVAAGQPGDEDPGGAHVQTLLGASRGMIRA